MRARVMMILLAGSVCVTAAAGQSQTPACASLEQCRELTLSAIANREYERAHDLAWRVFQLAPRQDPAAMTLLARAQSLSGRGDDAVVMLRRLAEAGVVVADIEQSDDYRRVRAHAQWPQLQAMMSHLTAPIAPAVAPGGAMAGKPSPPVAPSATRPGLKPWPSVRPAPVAPAASSTAVVPTLDLALPVSLAMPIAMAYDAVSARFVLADAGSDVLQIISESSGNVTPLVSSGWSGKSQTSAVAIDTRRGDLWVAGNDGRHGTLHQLQLISGRRLQEIELPAEIGKTRFTALAVGPSDVYVLDTAGGRVFARAPKAVTLRVLTELPGDIVPTAITVGASALYIAHAGGLLRLDLSTRAIRAVAAPEDANVANLQALAWYDGMLFGVQKAEDGDMTVRVRLSRRGTAVTRVEALERAGATAATLSRGVFYYLVQRPDGAGVALRGVAAGK